MVACDMDKHTLQLTGQATPFSSGHLRIRGGTARVDAVKDANIGLEQAIETSALDGSREVKDA
jgi:hypothetical protein